VYDSERPLGRPLRPAIVEAIPWSTEFKLVWDSVHGEAPPPKRRRTGQKSAPSSKVNKSKKMLSDLAPAEVVSDTIVSGGVDEDGEEGVDEVHSAIEGGIVQVEEEDDVFWESNSPDEFEGDVKADELFSPALHPSEPAPKPWLEGGPHPMFDIGGGSADGPGDDGGGPAEAGSSSSSSSESDSSSSSSSSLFSGFKSSKKDASKEPEQTDPSFCDEASAAEDIVALAASPCEVKVSHAFGRAGIAELSLMGGLPVRSASNDIVAAIKGNRREYYVTCRLCKLVKTKVFMAAASRRTARQVTQGRPLGYLAAWAKLGWELGEHDRELHRDLAVDRPARLAGREQLRREEMYDVFTDLEREADADEAGGEPLLCP
jgi:hypothetical protein